MRHKLLFIHRFIPFGIKSIVPNLHNANDADLYTVQTNGKLQGKVALITGGSRGIGLSIAKTFLREGCKVIITGRNEKKLKQICLELSSVNISYMVWDISQDSEISTQFDIAEHIFGSIDILVNNAGINKIAGMSQPIEIATLEYIRAMNDINVIGTRQMCIEFAEKYKSGEILNIISNTAIRPAIGIYWMSKWAMRSFTVAFGKECQNKGSNIHVNGLCPGPTCTDMMSLAKSNVILPTTPNKRFGLPEEIANLALIMVCSSMKGMNGKICICDGGQNLF